MYCIFGIISLWGIKKQNRMTNGKFAAFVNISNAVRPDRDGLLTLRIILLLIMISAALTMKYTKNSSPENNWGFLSDDFSLDIMVCA